MNEKSIVIICNGFWPNISPRAFRATELVKELSRQSYKVCVMKPNITDEQRNYAKIHGFEFIDLGLYNSEPLIQGKSKFVMLFGRIANRVLQLYFEYPAIELVFKVRSVLKETKSKYHAVISIASPYPIHWGVASIWNSRNNRFGNFWIADCGDPYCFQENDTFRPPFYFRWIEKWFMRKPNYITVPTENSVLGYFPEFRNKIVVIPQGFKFEDVRRREVISDGIVRFGYGGVFIPGKRDPSEFLTFLTSLSKEHKFEFHIFSKNSNFVRGFAEKDDRILIHDSIDRLELLELLSTFNFVVNFANSGDLQTPSKLIDYSIIEKPILHILPGVFSPKVFLEFMSGDYSNTYIVDSPDKYRIENVVSKFITLINGSEGDAQ